MNPDQTSAQNTAEGAGAVLRKARESKGMHISFLANTLRIPVARVKALEEDRWSDLPDLVFARALAQSVCRQLKIEAAPVLAAMPDPDPLRSVRVTAANSQPLGGLASGSRVTTKRWLMFALVLLALIALPLSTFLQELQNHLSIGVGGCHDSLPCLRRWRWRRRVRLTPFIAIRILTRWRSHPEEGDIR